MKRSDPMNRGGDAWAFLGPDGQPLNTYLGWLHYETQDIRRWTREHWDDENEQRRLRQVRAESVA